MNKRIKKKQAKKRNQSANQAFLNLNVKQKQDSKSVYKSGLNLRSASNLIEEQANLYRAGYIQTDKDISNSEMYARIKKYNDYVNRGLIKTNSVLDKYAAGSVIDEILSEDELEDMMDTAIRKAGDIEQKAKEREKIAPSVIYGF